MFERTYSVNEQLQRIDEIYRDLQDKLDAAENDHDIHVDVFPELPYGTTIDDLEIVSSGVNKVYGLRSEIHQSGQEDGNKSLELYVTNRPAPEYIRYDEEAEGLDL